MSDHWFVEQKNPFGGWSPQVIVGPRPTHKSTSGRVREFRADPVKVPEALKGEDIAKIRQFCSPDGEFVSVPEIAIPAVLEQI